MQKYNTHKTLAPHNIHSALIGTFTSTGGNYYTNSSTGVVIKLCTRKQVTALKPAHYAMLKAETGKELYLTSFYPQPNGTHTAEFSGNYYSVTLETGAIKFEPLK